MEVSVFDVDRGVVTVIQKHDLGRGEGMPNEFDRIWDH
jgi:hypothetical protein